MAPTNLSPNRDNYAIMKGIVLFRKTGDSLFRHVGNVSDLEYAPKVATLEHYSSMVGIKTKDLTIVLEKGGTLKMVMDEFTADNMELILLGNKVITDPLNISIDIFSQTSVTGELKFFGTNEIGPRWDFDFLNVDFLPTGTLKMISDSFGNIEVLGEVAVDPDINSFGTATMRLGDRVPQNIALPYITGPLLHPGLLTAHVGAWRNAVSVPTAYTYQWKKGGVDIGGATGKTYTTVVGDVGAMISVVITATNTIGAGVTATSGDFGPIT
jgi:hypothetical protein